MEQTSEQPNKELISEFNEAKLQIMRINYSWILINGYRRQGNMNAWKYELDTVWDEIRSKTIKKFGQEHVEEIKGIDKEIAQAKARQDIYDTLRKKTQELKLIADEVGMGIKMKDKRSSDMDA